MRGGIEVQILTPRVYIKGQIYWNSCACFSPADETQSAPDTVRGHMLKEVDYVNNLLMSYNLRSVSELWE